MFTISQASLVLSAVLPFVNALTVDTPTNWAGNQSNTITWTTAAGDPTTFTIELNNVIFHNSFALANNVNASLGTLTLPLPGVIPGAGYSLEFVNITDINQVFTSSQSFTIAEHDVGVSSTVATTATSAGTGTATSAGASSTSTAPASASGLSSSAASASSAASSLASGASSAASAASSLGSSAASAASSASSSAPSTSSGAALSNGVVSGSFMVVLAGVFGVVGL